MKQIKLTDKLLILILMILLVNYFNDYKEKKHMLEIKRQELSNQLLLDLIN